mmetsp:Transcript_76968/g.133175  ORF Transcript_76968/g.133175 Transcript_76968/m.133175 type:complete len:694 (+) Transcript_76968:71-2152(+)
MKASAAATLLFAVAASTALHGTSATSAPLGKVISMLGDLEAKITAEGVASKKLFEEKTEWCKDTVAQTKFEIKTGKAEIADLGAIIVKDSADIETFTSEIERLSGEIAADEADLKAATTIRDSETADFAAEEKELTETIGTLERAITIISREMSGGASMLQMKNTKNLAQALAAMVEASAFSSADAARLTAFVQSSDRSEDGDSDASLGAPAASVYESHSGTIVDTLQDLLEKAQSQLSSIQKSETTSQYNYEKLKQSLSDEIKYATEDLDAAKKGLAASSEQKAVAEGDLAMTSKGLDEDTAYLAEIKEDCMTASETYEAEVKSRAEELDAVAKAKQVIEETMPALSQVSLLQVSRSQVTSRKSLINFEVVRFVRDLGRKQHSVSLQQLSAKLASVIRLGDSTGADPFAKVKGLISDLIAKLQEEAGAEASEKAFCDEEQAKTDTKKGELDSDIASVTSKIDTASAKSAKLKEQVKALQADLAEMESSQAAATKLRQETSAAYVTAKADLELGLTGVRKAISVLTEYYSSAAFLQQPAAPVTYSKSGGAGKSIIDILEQVESDFAKNLATEEAEEADAAAAYEKGTQEYEITKATKTQDVKYLTQEYVGVDKTIAELSSDKEGLSTELSAVQEYDAKLKERCVAKPETYESRKARRDAEIAGLKQALEILETETAFMQRGRRGHKTHFLAPF